MAKGGIALAVSFCLAWGALGCEDTTQDTPNVFGIPIEPEGLLGIGSVVPDVNVRTISGTPATLSALTIGQPTVLVFYRGGWCGYCNRQLEELKQMQPDFQKMGYQILAISPDRPENLQATVDKLDLTFPLLSDSEMQAADAFGLSYRLDDRTVSEYKSRYGVDVETASGQTHHKLPIPAAYVIDSQNLIRFAYADPDYSTRVPSELLLDAARQSQGQ